MAREVVALVAAGNRDVDFVFARGAADGANAQKIHARGKVIGLDRVRAWRRLGGRRDHGLVGGQDAGLDGQPGEGLDLADNDVVIGLDDDLK